jgi:nicotinamide-nucleotide amidase
MGIPRVAIVVTGDEIVRGRVSDRNGGMLARWCDARGMVVDGMAVVGDDPHQITRAVRDGIARGADLVITTGGLGVTHDDLTMQAVADATARVLALDPAALALVRAALASSSARDRVPVHVREATDRKQAMLPVGSDLLAPIGTAPGCVLRYEDRVIVVLPGPPFEADRMWEAATGHPAIAALIARGGGPPALTLRLHGVIEPEMVAALETMPAAVREGARLGICAKAGELELTLADRAPGGAALLADAVDGAFPGASFTRHGRYVEEIVADLLLSHDARLAVAESCTGGMLGARLTALAGASSWFRGGVIAYDNAVKRNLLGVPEDTLASEGAVSVACAAAMAEGARSRLDATWGVSITGIAGPGGATSGKPVGTVMIGCAGPDGTVVDTHHFRGDRTLIRERSAVAALHLVRRCLGPREA